jgi:hypothetical protein
MRRDCAKTSFKRNRRRIPCAYVQRTLNIKLTSIGLLDLLVHLFFSPFLRPFLAGHKRASGACSQVPRAAFLRGSQETSLFVMFLGGTANPEGVRQLTDKAEARRAASAQASFPSRRACEKTVPEKMRGKIFYQGLNRYAFPALRSVSLGGRLRRATIHPIAIPELGRCG